MDFDLAPMMTGPPISRVVIGFLRNVVEPVACLDVEILAVDVKQRPVGTWTSAATASRSSGLVSSSSCR